MLFCSVSVWKAECGNDEVEFWLPGFPCVKRLKRFGCHLVFPLLSEESDPISQWGFFRFILAMEKKNIFWSIWNCFAYDCPISEGDFAPLNRTARPTQQPSCWRIWMYQAPKMWVMSTKITACYVCYLVMWNLRVTEACVPILRVSGSSDQVGQIFIW